MGDERRSKIPTSTDNGGWCHRCNAHSYFHLARNHDGMQHPTQSHNERVLEFYCPNCHGVTAVAERGTWSGGDLRWQVIGTWPTATPPSAPDYLPDEIGELYREAATCLSSGCYRSAVAMTRAAIDAAVSDQGATGKTLYDKIESMKGKLRDQLIEFADELKLGGNAAVHDFNEEWSEEEASERFVLLEEVLSELYEKTSRLNKVRQLGANRQPVTSTP